MDKILIIELAKGGTISESERLWDLTFKNNLERMVIDKEDLKDILDLEEYMFIDIDGGDDSDSDFSDDDDDNDESDQEKETIDLSPISLASTAQIAAQTIAAIQQATQERKDAASRVLVTKITITNDKKEAKKHQAKRKAKEERKAKKRALKAQLVLERKNAQEKATEINKMKEI